MTKGGYPDHIVESVSKLIKDGTLEEVVRIIQSDIDSEWKRTSITDTDTREALYHESHALGRILIQFQIIADSNKW